MICMFYLTGEVIDDKITTQCNGEDRYMSNLIKQVMLPRTFSRTGEAS